MIAKLHRLSAAILRRTNLLCGIGLFATTLITVCDVLLRWAFGVVIPGASDFAGLALAMVAAWAIAACALDQSHITIDIVLEHLPIRLQRLFRAVSSAVAAFALSVIGYYAVIMTTQSFRSSSRTISEIALPLGPLQLVWTAGLWVGVAVALVAMMKSITELSNKEMHPAAGSGGNGSEER